MSLASLPVASPIPAPCSLCRAAEYAREALRQRIEEGPISPGSAQLRMIFGRLDHALRSPRAGRDRARSASPHVVERSGRVGTLIEMIEDEPEGGTDPVRLARLLIRAIAWRPESFPHPVA